MRHRDGEESDGDTRSSVRFTSSTDSNQREKVLDTEDAARGPLSGIFRLTDSPRVMKKLQECERASKRKKDDPPAAVTPTAAPTQTQTPKTQVNLNNNYLCYFYYCFSILMLIFLTKHRKCINNL